MKYREREMEAMDDNTSGVLQADRLVLHPSGEMAEWSRHDYILHSYWPISYSRRASLRSYLYLHNESVNICSRLFPAGFFLIGAWHMQRYLTNRHPGVYEADLIAFSVFLLAAATCLS